MTQPVGIAIVGTGFMGGVHARAARTTGQSRLIGVLGSNPDRSRAAADELRATRAYASLEHLLNDADVEAVHICTPNDSHAEYARRALEAGKHVICEKPLALSADEARELVALADLNGLVTAIPFVYRYYASVREARDRIRKGVSGRVRLVHGSYLQDWLLLDTDANWRVNSDKGGRSRAFADIGSHWADLAQFVTGERINAVSARLYRAFDKRPRQSAVSFSGTAADSDLVDVSTEDAASVQIEFTGGGVGQVLVSQISPGHKNQLSLEVDTADESLRFQLETPETLTIGRRGHDLIIKRDPANTSADAARMSIVPAGHPQGYPDAFALLIDDFYTTIRSGHRPDGLPSFADGLAMNALTDAILESSDARHWVHL